MAQWSHRQRQDGRRLAETIGNTASRILEPAVGQPIAVGLSYEHDVPCVQADALRAAAEHTPTGKSKSIAAAANLGDDMHKKADSAIRYFTMAGKHQTDEMGIKLTFPQVLADGKLWPVGKVTNSSW